jgi:two-component system sensor kinase FixL
MACGEATQGVHFAVELAPDAMFRISSSGRIVYANPAAHRMLGYGPEELLSLEIFDIAPSYLRGEWPDRCRQLRQMRARVFETTYLTKQQHPLPVDVSVSHQRYDGEDFAEIVARDISAKRELEERLFRIQDRERARIGRDLHDNIGQRLTGIAFSLDALGRDLEAHDSSLAASSRDLAANARDALDQIRALAHGLLPVRLSLTEALNELATSVRRSMLLSCEVRCSCGQPIENETVANNVYRIAQEAITNAVKHGGAQSVTIECAMKEGWLTVDIVDDGQGIREPIEPGLGTRIMKYRAESMGGNLHITPTQPAGTAVRLTCPIAAR